MNPIDLLVIGIIGWYQPPWSTMPDLSLRALDSDQSTLTPDSLINTANAAANLVCGLYQQYPTGIVPSIGSTSISRITDGLLRSLCAPRNQLPPPQQEPFTGGQCPTLYKVDVRVGSQGSTPGPVIYRRVSGPIRGIVVRRSPNNDGSQDVFMLAGPSRPGADWTGDVRVGSSFAPTPVSFIASAEREDLEPDTCGNPVPVYPPSLPPANEYTNNTNITIGGNTISVPVTLIPTVFAPVNIFRPEFNVDVGGVNVNFALDGITFSPSINIDSPISLPSPDTRPVLPPSKPSTPSKCPDLDLSPLFPRFDNIDDQLDVIEACACGPDQVVKIQSYGSANSRTISLPANTVGVRVFITSIGPKVPSQYGNGGAPDVLFIGWCSFGNGTPAGDRVPISHEASFFPAPERATAFSYTTVYESLARLEVVYLEDVT